MIIISFKPEQLGLEDFIVCLRAHANVGALRERMLQRAKVAPGSYAHRLVEDLHSAIFVHSLDLKADYETYFAPEYASFGEYIRRRTHIPSAVADQVIAAVDASIGVYYVRRSFDFLSDTRGFELLARLLEDPPSRESS